MKITFLAVILATLAVAAPAMADVGQSPAIEAFQASRLIEAQTPEQLASLEAQTATAANVSLDPAIEAARVQRVVDWFIVTFASYFAQDADLDWAPSQSTYTPEEAGEAAAAFAAAAHEARLALEPQPFDADFAAFESAFLAFQASLSPIIPAEWVPERTVGFQGSLDATYVIGVINGATTFPEVLGTIGSISIALHESEDLTFAALVAQE